MKGNTMLQEYLGEESIRDIDGHSIVGRWDEYTFFQEAVNDDEYGGEAI